MLGATGSVGMSTVDLLKRGNGKYRVEAVTAHKNAGQLAQIARELNARLAVVADPSAYGELKDALSGTGIQAASGEAALIEAAERPADWVMAAVSGSVGLKPTLAAAKRGATVALANKECLVCAGAMFMRTAAAAGTTVLPVDSEHNAIFQALTAGPREDVSRIVITASGGPFRTWTREAMRGGQTRTGAQASELVDGSEDHHRFRDHVQQVPRTDRGASPVRGRAGATRGAGASAIHHPRHGRIPRRLGGGATRLARHAHPDRALPGLADPDRWSCGASSISPKIGSLTFEAPDPDRFPALALGRRALETGGAAPTILNAANEVAVAAFIAGRIGFGGIAELVEATLGGGRAPKCHCGTPRYR